MCEASEKNLLESLTEWFLNSVLGAILSRFVDPPIIVALAVLLIHIFELQVRINPVLLFPSLQRQEPGQS